MTTYLRTLREKNNLTLRQLADELGLHWTTLHSFESEKRIPSFETADKIAEYFGVPVEEIFPKYRRRSPYPENTTASRV